MIKCNFYHITFGEVRENFHSKNESQGKNNLGTPGLNEGKSCFDPSQSKELLKGDSAQHSPA